MTRLTAAGCLRLSTASAAMLVSLNALPAAAQDATGFDLGTMVVEWENIGRPLQETSAANTLVEGDEITAPGNRDIYDAMEGQPNVILDNGPELPVIRGISGSNQRSGRRSSRLAPIRA